MKFFFELLPIVIFFIAYKIFDVYTATIAAIFITVIQVFLSWFRYKKIDPMLLCGLVLITIFGGATLFFRDEMFIKWKPTILYWILSAVLLISASIFKKNLIKAAMIKYVAITDKKWTLLNLAWSIFFTGLGFLNLHIAHNYSTDTWVNFKLFGSTILMLIFVLLQSVWLANLTKK